jgi:hypothetical protein
LASLRDGQSLVCLARAHRQGIGVDAGGGLCKLGTTALTWSRGCRRQALMPWKLRNQTTDTALCLVLLHDAVSLAT